MIVSTSISSVFGTPMKGVIIQMPVEEAEQLLKMVQQGFAHPPMVGLNTDYKAQNVGAEFTRQVKEAVNAK